MNRKLQFVTLTAIVAVSVTVGMFLASGFNLTPATSASPAMSPGASPAALPSFAEIAERANPAVVSITSTSMVREREPRSYRDPFEFFFGPGPDRRRRDEPPSDEDPQEDAPERREDSGGSGFIISDDGYVLTNYHVVEKASRVEVRLADDAREWKAEIIGTDEATDLALIKIDAGKKLPTIPLGDSERIRVGEWVVAIGNPLAWEHTVTVGVVSARGRRLVGLNRDSSLDDFIQTDAAINFGNSGGPLLNIAGEAIGINTAISSQGQGIGFAIPINMAKQIMDQLKERGRVSRGYLGIQIQDINRLPPEERESFGLQGAKGAFVESVEKNLPASVAGVEPGDAIVAVDGRPIASSAELIAEITRRAPDDKVRLTVLRGGKSLDLTALLIDRQGAGEGGEEPESERPPGSPATEKLLGFRVESITPATARDYNLKPDTQGVVVTAVDPLSMAYDKGLREGSVIAEVNRNPVANLDDFRRETSSLKAGDLVNFYVRAGSVSRFLVLRMDGSPDAR
jgi:serine protease Do